MRQKFTPLCISIFLLVLQLQAQDILISTNGTKDTITITEITPDLIKFSRAEHPGISYSKLKKEVSVIQYADGKKEFVSADNNKQLSESTHLTDKGNKVFLEADNTVEQLTIPYLTDYITKWNYWKVVTDINNADFILALDMRKSGAYAKGYVVLKNKDGIEISHSKSIKGDGWNIYLEFADRVLNDYLKKRYW